MTPTRYLSISDSSLNAGESFTLNSVVRNRGGGGGGGIGRPPSHPGTIRAEGGDGGVTLTWDAPSSQGSSRIQHYEYRIDGKGRWISIGSTDTTHTVTGLVNDTVYVFQVRAVNRIGRSPASDPAEATPRAAVALDFAHFANGAGITSEIVLVNVDPIRSVPPSIFTTRKAISWTPKRWWISWAIWRSPRTAA